MKVIQLKRSDNIYSCFAYLVLGTWNKIEDVNTLVDTGTDDHFMWLINNSSTGVGKNAVEQIILTHNHFDHSGGLFAMKAFYHAKTFGFHPEDGIDVVLKNYQFIRMGDADFVVIHTPGHSSDSICLYSPEEKVIFSGDVPLVIRTPGSSYTSEFVIALEKIASLDIETIYSGHDDPIRKNASALICKTLENVLASQVIPSTME